MDDATLRPRTEQPSAESARQLPILPVDLPSESHRRQARAVLDAKTKPLGSLGRLEDLAAELCAIQRRVPPSTVRKRVVVFAADHGVAALGTSAYPREVTAQMVANFGAGGAAVNVLARQAGAEVEVVDMGVLTPVGAHALDRRVRAGSRNFLEGPAMTAEECKRALASGLERAMAASTAGVGVLAVGEMGIGNTTSAAALLSLLIGAPSERTVGTGTGVDAAGLQRKREVVDRALALHRDAASDPFAALCAVGGLEIAGIAGAVLGAAASHLPVVIDGFICTVAALAAVRMVPEARPSLLFGHRSPETGHEAVLEALDASPLLDLGMRLGEGSGAVLAFGVVEAASRIMAEMASFADAGVSTATEEGIG